MFQGNAIISLILTYRYFILLPLAFIEGPILALVLGFLVHLGYFDFIPAFLVMCAGDFFPDISYYYIGHFGNQKNFLQKYGTRFKFIKNNFPIIEKLWRDHGFKTMFLSKIAYGMSTALLVSSGLARMPFKKFAPYAFVVTLLQYGIIMTLGYYLGYSYVYAAQYVKLAGVIFALILIAFIFVYVKIQKYANQEINKLEKLEELEQREQI
jgi:membrane protein DedA with SNARE-associated domain